MENVREIILDTLLSLEKDGGLSHQVVRNVLNKYDYLLFKYLPYFNIISS